MNPTARTFRMIHPRRVTQADRYYEIVAWIDRHPLGTMPPREGAIYLHNLAGLAPLTP